jgi:hypothetical protein
MWKIFSVPCCSALYKFHYTLIFLFFNVLRNVFRQISFLVHRLGRCVQVAIKKYIEDDDNDVVSL